MLKVNIVAAGKIKEKYFADAIEEYSKRLTRFVNLNITEVSDYDDKDGLCAEKEGRLILPKLKGYVILCCPDGKKYSSEGFAGLLEKLALNSGEITLVIGGSRGVSAGVRAAANELISFSDMTFPHRLFRVMVLEQLYRACTINNNISYHK